MKKIILLCLTFVLMQGVCWAGIKSGSDNFDGKHWYYVEYDYSPPVLSLENWSINATFNLVFPTATSNNASKNFILTFEEDEVYAIQPTIKMKIDNIVYSWATKGTSTRGNGNVDIIFSLPDDVCDSLLKTQSDIIVRFFYKTLSGDYQKTFKVPYKKIKEVQELYTTYNQKQATN